jgi:hypothetical protein
LRWLALVLALCLAAGTAAHERDAELLAGIAAVNAKDYTSAIGTLSLVVRRLGADPAFKDDLVAAYLHLGLAFAGLGQESPARSQFTQALLRKPDLRLDVKEAPELAKKAFAEAQREAAPVIAVGEQQKKKSGKLPLILAGVAAAGAGAAVVVSSGGTNAATSPPPTFGILEPARFFSFAGISGSPYLLLQSGEPASGSTVSVATTRPRFLFHSSTPAQAYPRVKATVTLETPDRGVCWSADSSPFALAAATTADVVVDAFAPVPQCVLPFTTLAVSARLVNLDTGLQVSVSSFIGGYKVVP